MGEVMGRRVGGSIVSKGKEPGAMAGDGVAARHASIREAVCAAFGDKVKITAQDRIYGGDINDAYRLRLSDRSCVFVKTNSIRNFSFFRKESRGLLALREAGKIGVPQVLGLGTDTERGVSFLLLEYIESARRKKDYWEVFGRELGELHRAVCPLAESRYGFTEDNYIGASVQKNTPKERWVDFYRECRLMPQIEMAKPYLGTAALGKFDRLLSRLDSYLREPETPSLLHGDLWSGNVLCGGDGKAWILDPAVYIGDFETDLAMTELFGSLPEAFYRAYHEVNPIDGGYRERKGLYHLYHLLNHLNLFGRSYLGGVLRILDRYAGV